MLFVFFLVPSDADYVPSFWTGYFGIMLLLLAPNVLSFFSAAAVIKQIFLHANRVVLFYGLTILFVLLCLAAVALQLRSQNTDSSILLSIAAIFALTVSSMKLILVPRDDLSSKHL